jgi:hypothetical protein
LARKEDFPHITYYCPHCNALNTSNQSEVRLPSPSARENSVTPVAEIQNSVTVKDSKVVSSVPMVKELLEKGSGPVVQELPEKGSVPVVQELPEKDAPMENKEKQQINEKEES